MPSSDERAACLAYGAGIAPAALFYIGTDGKAGMPPFARPAASGGHKSRISRRACQLPAGMPHTQEVFCNDKQSLSLNHAVQAAPFTQGSLQCGKSPRGGRQKISAATGRSTKCARGARTSKQGLCPPRLWRHEPQAKYNEDPPAKRAGFFRRKRERRHLSFSWLYQTMRVDFRKKYRKIFIYNFYSDAIGRSRRRYSQKGRA